mgnify:FL=1
MNGEKRLILSVIIPVYNSEKYIKNCVESIIAQDEEVEIILIDDGSTDSSGKICDEYSEEYKFIKTFHINNGGPSQARNYGINIAKGEYIQFIDSDDELEKNCFYNNKKIVQSEKPDILLYGANAINTNKKSKSKIITSFYERNYEIEELLKQLENDSKPTVLNYVWNKWYKRELIKNNGILFEEECRLGEDFLFNCRVFSKCEKIYISNETYYKYYIRGNESLTGKFNRDELQRRREMKTAFTNLYEEWNLSKIGKDKMNKVEGEMGYTSIRAIKKKNCNIEFSEKVCYVSEFMNSEYKELITEYLRDKNGIVKKINYFLLKNKMKKVFVIFNDIILGKVVVKKND